MTLVANTYEAITTSETFDGGRSQYCETEIWWCPSIEISEGTFSVTANYGQTNDLSIYILEIANLKGLGPITSNNDGGTPGTSATISQTQNDIGPYNLIAGMIAPTANASSIGNLSSGYTTVGTSSYDSAGYKKTTGQVTESASLSWTGSAYWAAVLASFYGSTASSVVQSNYSEYVSASSITASFNTSPTPGNAVIVLVSSIGSYGNYFSSIVDNQIYTIGSYSPEILLRSRYVANDSFAPSLFTTTLAGGFKRAPFYVQENRRKFFPQPEQLVNSLLSTHTIPITQFFASQELGEVPRRARTAHMPDIFRPTPNPFVPFVPFPFANYDWPPQTYTQDKLKGQDFEVELFLLPPIAGTPLLPTEQPVPVKRKYFATPEQVYNSLILTHALPVSNPFRQIQWDNVFSRKRPQRFDDPPNLLVGIFNIPAGPPFYQTDFPTPQRAFKKYLTTWECVNALVPNYPPVPNIVITFPGGGTMFGVFSQHRILGFWTASN